ncbi:phenylalanine--tRNA ligase subunit beta [Enterobacteriaceae endosymbiont of Donacia tomentosa]|uniref:phenylalanine--tRNA ligase subunit beta n=1 Tax=Enterobacteriaceae endosymbiont of Donacia tomentosa TaxID=2675787 RepID=UPI001449379D|nr:phenylalanine--tRNA ligase subunit beta [Enterobacteriaceae endosymbiont of Donacia tomentosa]QJC31561.1 phenylalanine--tRNA ligase subunit beta [Enterobacteriaceae endosymbiont of Donacia tomentosa]
MMKFSESWLREWVDFNQDIYSLSEKLTMLGFEVEKVDTAHIKKKYDNIYVGEVVYYSLYKKNPKIYKLIIDIHREKLLNILSFLKVKCKIKVIIATKKSFLYQKFIKIPKYNFLFKSDGLLCSQRIFTLENFDFIQDSIIKVPRNVLNGIDANQFLIDKILSINIPFNRPDCLSILGITRDLASIKNIHFKFPYKNTLLKEQKKYKININFDKDIENILHNYKYSIIKNINLNQKIPNIIIERLLHSNFTISTKNPLLNIKNYIFLELGYPIQFYDLNKIEGDVYIKNGKKNTFFIINSKNQKINFKNNCLLTIFDKNKILSIPGLVQNKYILTNIKTENILIECLLLNKKYIQQKISNKYNKFHNFSYMYEKYLDPLMQNQVLIRTMNLLLQIFGGNISKINSFNIKNINYINKKIQLKYQKVNKILGFKILPKNIIDILTRLGFLISKQIVYSCDVKIPSWRQDIHCEEDLIEEIIRVYDYNKIPNKNKSNIYLICNNLDEENILETKYIKFNIKKIKNILINKGYNEVINYSFINPKIQSKFYPTIESIKINNPITTEMSVMRNSLFYGLIKNIVYNQNRQQKNLRFFEYGLCFHKNLRKKLGISQKLTLGGIINGNLYENHWDLKNKKVDFYDIKGDIESILNPFNEKNTIKFCPQNNDNNKEIFNPYKSAIIYLNNILIGYIGMLSNIVINHFNISNDTFFFELFCDKITTNNFLKIKEIPNYPINRREISLIISNNIRFVDILNEINNLKIKEIIKIKLFDIYTGSNIPTEYKSITISLFIQNKLKTLNEEEINNILYKCIDKLKSKFKIILRDQKYKFI